MTELRRITEWYRLDKQVAASDAGSVFRGTDIQSGATVAVKLINSDGGESDEQRERFLETAGLLQSLQHPSLPRVVDFGFTTAGSAFLVTEFLHGSSFEEVAGSAPGRVISLLLLVVDGLEVMSAQGISTRNLRADNLLVVPGEGGEQVKILGLGSAVLEPGAMPVLDGYPEDLRAFGLLACRMLRVQTDFKVGIPLEVAVELEDIEALRALLEAALHGDPEGHYPSWADVRQALRAALFGAAGDKATARTEAFATHPGLAADGAPAATMQIRRSPPGWDDPPPPPEPPPAFDPKQGTVLIARPQLPPPPPQPSPESGTMLLSSPWAAEKAAPARQDDLDRQDLDSTVMVRGETPRNPEPLSASQAGATARIQLPPSVAPRAAASAPVVAPPSPAAPEPPAAPKRRLPETTEIPAARLTPPPPAPPKPVPTPESMVGTLEIPRAVVQDVAARPAPSVPAASVPTASRSVPVVPVTPSPPPAPPPPVPGVPDLPPPPPQRAIEPTPPPAAAAPPPQPFVPPPPPAEFGVDTIARPPEVRVVPAAAKSQRRLLLMIGIPIAAILLLAVGLALVWFLRRPAAPPPAPKVVAKPVAPPPVVTPPPAPAPLPIHPQLALAQASLGAKDLKGVKAAIDAITLADQAAFRPDEREIYQQMVEALTPLKREELAGNLSRALDRGDLRQLRALADAVPAADQAALPPDVQANLARARKAVGIDASLSRAQKAGNSLEMIHQADVLLAELPHASRAADQKERAAAGIETGADAAIEAGQYDAALAQLNGLRQAWPDRAGLSARIERVIAERKTDQDLESVLAAVAAAERSNKPLEGQRLLAGVKPNRRYAARFQEARQRLDGEVAQLDRLPPEIKPRGTPPEFDKGKTAVIPLTITDDFGVRGVEGWARPEKGQYVKVTIRHLNGSDYVMDVPAEVHKNETIEYYATATDASGHVGQLASADHPNQLKRKSWLKGFLGKDKKNGG
jgi:serine/threonine protein kinase